MSTQRLENQQGFENNQQLDVTNSTFHQQLSSSLYNDMSIFKAQTQSDNFGLPTLQIAGVGDQAMAAALKVKSDTGDKQATGTKSYSIDDNSFAAWNSWMSQRGLEKNRELGSGYMTVYTPNDGRQEDQFGCIRVDIFSHDGAKSIYGRTSHFSSGDRVSESFDEKTGKRESRTEFNAATGKSLTTFDGVNVNADTLKKAYDEKGVAGLKEEIEKVLKHPNAWSKVEVMLKELAERSITTYWTGNNLYMDNFDFGTGLRDSHVLSKPTESTPPPAAEERKPAAKGGPTADDWRRFGEVLRQNQP